MEFPKIKLQDMSLEEAATAFEKLHSPLCAFAPRRRDLLIDFKDESGTDRSTELVCFQPPDWAEDVFIVSVREYILDRYATSVSSIIDVTNGTPKLLFYDPAFMEECIKETAAKTKEEPANEQR